MLIAVEPDRIKEYLLSYAEFQRSVNEAFHLLNQSLQ